MRTTVDLPDDLHDVLRSLARDRGSTLSRTVADLLRERLAGVATTGEAPAYLGVDRGSGLPVVHLPGMLTVDDVRALEDEG